MGAFLGYLDGKYHIPGWILGQVTTFLFSPWKAKSRSFAQESRAFSYPGKWNTIHGTNLFPGISPMEAK
jgi:hypothetical protein